MARRTWEQYERYILQQWPLTRREVQIALECIKGRKNKEIASLLRIGAETVNKTLDNIYRTTGVNGRDQLVAKLLIADIENTPLQQAVTLAGEGSALVGAGFLATLYASRSERKRPRADRVRLPKTVAEQSKTAKPTASTERRENSEHTAAAAVASSDISCLGASAANLPGGSEAVPWMITPESLMETTAGES